MAVQKTHVRESTLMTEAAGSSDSQYTSTAYTVSNFRWHAIFTTPAKKTQISQEHNAPNCQKIHMSSYLQYIGYYMQHMTYNSKALHLPCMP
jgi:hypothetical protein